MRTKRPVLLRARARARILCLYLARLLPRIRNEHEHEGRVRRAARLTSINLASRARAMLAFMDQLALCPTCRRHVKRRDASCPFCRTTMPAAVALAGALVVGLGLSMAACDRGVALYGAPPGGGDTGGSTGSGGAGGEATTSSGGSGGIGGGLEGGVDAAYAPPPPPFDNG